MSSQQTLQRAVTIGGVRVVSAAEARPSILQYERLEAQSWAPWLRFSRPVLVEHVRSFPEAQFFAFDSDGLVGALSTNRISWDGDPANLESWDAVAGVRQDYLDTHDTNGNTLVTLSMSIATRARGAGIARQLLDAAQSSAKDRGLDHVIGSYRPARYGSFKLSDERDFLAYVEMRDQEGVPLDPWLRTLTRAGMKRLKVDRQAMVVDVAVRDFEAFRRQSSSTWVRTVGARDAFLHEAALPFPVAECEFWEAGQAGTWYVHRASGRAIYIESGIWGTVMLDGPEA
jgi:GNAT superfamily N-acetyltransferase